jgi:hypothetical protein
MLYVYTVESTSGIRFVGTHNIYIPNRKRTVYYVYTMRANSLKCLDDIFFFIYFFT